MAADSAAVKATLSRASTTILYASHRIRGVDCVQASCQVPDSSSRASMGAPRNPPIAAGTKLSRISNGVV